MSDGLFESIVVLLIHAGIVLAAIISINRWTKVDHQKALAIIGAIGIGLFAICIGIPFFFQGYAEWSPGGERQPLGWTRNPLVSLFAYQYSSKWMGFAWLSTSIVCLSLGRLSATRAIMDSIGKSALILVACIMLTRLYAFAETINLVLE